MCTAPAASVSGVPCTCRLLVVRTRFLHRRGLPHLLQGLGGSPLCLSISCFGDILSIEENIFHVSPRAEKAEASESDKNVTCLSQLYQTKKHFLASNTGGWPEGNILLPGFSWSEPFFPTDGDFATSSSSSLPALTLSVSPDLAQQVSQYDTRRIRWMLMVW